MAKQKGNKKEIAPKERVFNVRPSPNQEKDWGVETVDSSFMPPDMTEDRIVRASPEELQLPAKKNLAKGQNWWNIGDQGLTGSCVGWALADGVLRYHLVKARVISSDVPNRPSVRYIWMASKEIDEFTNRPSTFIESSGTSLKSALDVGRLYGIVKEQVLPFELSTDYLYLGDPNAFWSLAARIRIIFYVSLGASFINKMYTWKKWLAEKGPILTRLDVDDAFMYAHGTGILTNYVRPTGGNRGHAVCVVGYTPTTFIIRNSWGTSWGNSGYAEVSLNYAMPAFTEAYGVNVLGIPG